MNSLVLSGVATIVLSGVRLSCYQACGGGLTHCSENGIRARKSSKYLEPLKRSLGGRFELRPDSETDRTQNSEELVEREPERTPSSAQLATTHPGNHRRSEGLTLWAR